MRVREDVLRWDFPALNLPSFPAPKADLGALPSISDFFGAIVVSGFLALIYFIAYRLIAMPEGHFLKIQRKFLK